MLSLKKFKTVVGHYWISGEPIAIIYVCVLPVEESICGTYRPPKMNLPVWYSSVVPVAPVVFQQDPGEQRDNTKPD
jgi:hypothetical protein